MFVYESRKIIATIWRFKASIIAYRKYNSSGVSRTPQHLRMYFWYFPKVLDHFLSTKVITKETLKYLICCQETEYLWAFLQNLSSIPVSKYRMHGTWKEQKVIILKEQHLIIGTLYFKEWVSNDEIHRDDLEPDSQRLIPHWLFLLKVDILNQFLSNINHFK